MISKKQFNVLNQERWQGLDRIASGLQSKESLPKKELRELPALFRKVCKDRAIAEDRMYGLSLTGRLNALVMSLYHVVYQRPRMLNPLRFMARTFPGAIRHNRALFAVSVMLFWLPFLLIAFSPNWSLNYIQSLLGADGMYQLDQMYGKSGDPLEYGRSEYGGDFFMFCFYVKNNVSIDFQCFAGGILFGLGTLFYTIFNGLYIGAVFGYVHEAGDPEKLYKFVAGHSAFEIIGLHLSTLAGLRLGLGLVNPGNQSRISSLIRSCREALVIIVGAGILTFLAAIIEGFWSGHPFPVLVKYGVGIALWILTLMYIFSGRKEWYERP